MIHEGFTPGIGDPGAVTSTRAEVILLEPFFKGSHAAWAEGYARKSRRRVRILSLEGIHWKWRFHHSALHFAQILSKEFSPPRALLVSAMTDAAALRGLLPGSWAGVPLFLYFHENQLTYPLPPGQVRDLHYAWIQVQSCKAARLCVFNSSFHKRDFLEALPSFLRSFPDHRPLSLAREIEEKSRVVPPGVETALFRKAREGARPRGSPLRILWNHRWEGDKEPLLFLEILLDLAREGLPFQVVLAGRGSEALDPEPERMVRALGERVAHRGFAPRETYPGLLASCHVLVSTSRHDFFGISVAEGMAAGLLPLLPNRQNYPFLLPPGPSGGPAREWASLCLFQDPGELEDKLRYLAKDPARALEAEEAMAARARAFDLAESAKTLDSLLEEGMS